MHARKDRYSNGVDQVPHDIVLKQDKEVHIESKRGKVFSHKVVNSARAVKSLYLLVRKCSRPKTHSILSSESLNDCELETDFFYT